LKLSDMKAKVRRMVKVDGCKIIMVDYISLIDAEQPRIPRHEQIAEISRSTKALAKELDIPIIMLSQLTRDSEGKTPTLASLAETRSLEQDADVIMFLHRPRAGTEETGERPTVIPTDLIVAKNRNGPIGTAKLIFIPNITKFRDATEKQTEEII
jgi:replicative DNA helicase